MLILQGEADYQVTMEDFKGWQKALAGRKNAAFKHYPRLGHTFIDMGKKMAMPMDYAKPGNMLRKVVEDIVAWVKGLR